ncbi:MAG: trypsin-like peptidase domain-containing protein [Ruminococcus sp.]|nr:trypsin-like peptidase domain-containing protein [Ruminococcus sp.]
MYNEEDRREDQQTSGEQAPRYEHYQFHEETGIVPDRVPPVRNKKETDSFGKKAGTTVALAVLFGLVASAVFLSVSFVAGKYLKTDEKSTHLETTQSVAGTVTDNGSDGENGADTESGNGTVASVAQASMPSVVAITTVSVQEIPSFFGYGSRQYKSAATGSGIIVGDNDEELLIATNNHVVDGASTLSVCFIGNDVMNAETETENADDTGDLNLEDAVSARIKGTDSDNDLAVIAVKKADIPEDTLSEIKIAQIGSSEDLVVGQQVVAIGNALGYGQSVTSGWISALNRTISTEDGTSSSGLIQTDAAINPGNSGGALLNMKGELIGINSAKYADSTVEGMGYAIPISRAKPILEDLMNRQTREMVSAEEKGYLGVVLSNLTTEAIQMYDMPEGAFVRGVEEKSPAEKGGICKGDIIVKFDGQSVTSGDDLLEKLQYYKSGEKIEAVVARATDGEYQESTVEITLGSRSENS